MAFSNPLVGGENGELVRPSIQSPDYVAGVSGWTINRDGSAEFNNVTIRLDLTTGSIVVGPDTGPQVIIRVADDGLGGLSGVIDFPTNTSYEHLPAAIFSSTAPTERLSLLMRSGQTDVGSVLSQLELLSGENGTGANVTATLRAQQTPTVFSELDLRDDNAYLYVEGASGFSQIRVTLADDLGHFAMVASDEVYAADSVADGNYLARVVRGFVSTGATVTTTITGANTAIGGTALTSTFLEDGFAYEVEVQVPIRTSGATSASGTQRLAWSLWRGAVGGTRLGQELFMPKVGAVTAVTESVPLKFVFRNTGNFTGTLNLAARQVTGADVIQSFIDTNYSMTVAKIGDPARITNL